MNNKTIALSAVAIAIVSGGAYYAYEEYEHSIPQSAEVTPNSSTEILAYKDGNYSVTQSYEAPSGKDTFGLSITLKDNTVTETSFTNGGTSDVSKKLQDDFSANYKAVVIGKDINTLGSIDTIAGASLTTNAFKQAIDAVKNQAK